MTECIFCKIIDKKLPADIFFENEKIIVFKDTKPKAPVHLLILPKEHIVSVDKVEEKDKDILGSLLLVAKEVAKEVGINDMGYKLTINVGEGAGQEVPHLHIHLLGGWEN